MLVSRISRITGHGHESRVTGHESRVTGHWSPDCRSRLFLREQNDHARRLFRIHRRVVHHHGIRGAHERRHLALAVAPVALVHFRQHLFKCPMSRPFLRSSCQRRLGAHFGRSIEKNLQVRVRENHRCRCRGLPSPRRPARPRGAARPPSDGARPATTATTEAACETSDARIASVTSSPSSITRCLPSPRHEINARRAASSASRSGESSGTPSRSAFQPTARYIAPLSRCV